VEISREEKSNTVLKNKISYLNISEIFYSIQGEGSYSGYPCVFIRVGGCNLNCIWCDTKYAFSSTHKLKIEEIVKKINKYPTNMVEITGGEPLLQKNIYFLFNKINMSRKKILLETSGSLDISKVPSYVHIIMDLKAPGSGEEKYNDYDNIIRLKPSDDIKIVISDENDFRWVEKLFYKNNFKKFEKPIILQPVHNILHPSNLSDWIKNSKVPFRLGLQLQKYIYPKKNRGV